MNKKPYIFQNQKTIKATEQKTQAEHIEAMKQINAELKELLKSNR